MKPCAFSLVEVLASVAVVSVLFALLFPTFQSMRSDANTSHCLANLRQLTVGTQLWIAENDGAMPDANQWQQATGKYTLRPYFSVNSDNTTKQRGCWTCPEAYRIHPSPKEGLTDNLRTYSINLYACGSQDGQISSDVKNNPLTIHRIKTPSKMSLFMDGDLITATTAVRRYAHSGMTSPSNIWKPEKPYGLLAIHQGRLNVAFVDGHAESIPAELLPSAATEGSTTKTQKHAFWGRYPE